MLQLQASVTLRYDLPWGVAAPRQRHVTHSQLVVHAQNGETAVDHVAALQPDERGEAAVVKGVQDACTATAPTPAWSGVATTRHTSAVLNANVTTYNVPSHVSLRPGHRAK